MEPIFSYSRSGFALEVTESAVVVTSQRGILPRREQVDVIPRANLASTSLSGLGKNKLTLRTMDGKVMEYNLGNRAPEALRALA